jgi:CelD/BcsL family acetyltransferase involved in cellulose biosynthesis
VRERGLLSRLGSDQALGETIAALYCSRETGAAMGVLFLDGQPVAAEGGFRCRDRFFAYTSAYRPDRRADGVGKVAIAEMVEWCAANGVTTYDKGAPADPYKLEWTDRLVPVADRAVPLTVLGWAWGMAVEARLKPLVKQKLEVLPAPLRAQLLRLTRYNPAAAS